MTDADPISSPAPVRSVRSSRPRPRRPRPPGRRRSEVVDAVAEQQLFWTMVPGGVGGQEAPIGTCLGVFEELAYADGSTGWSVMANASSSAFAALYCDDDAVATMFPAGCAGHPRGHVRTGRARRGRRMAATGSPGITGSGAGAATRAGSPPARWRRRTARSVTTDAGLPSLLVGFLRPEQVEHARQLGRHGPRRHRQLRLRRGGRARRRRLHVPPARSRTAARWRRCTRSDCSDSSHPATPGSRWASASVRSSRCWRSPRASSAWGASSRSPRNRCSNTSSRCTTRRCAPRARTCTSRSKRPKPQCSRGCRAASCSSSGCVRRRRTRRASQPTRRASRTHGRAPTRCATRASFNAASETSMRVRSTSTSTTTRSRATRRRCFATPIDERE